MPDNRFGSLIMDDTADSNDDLSQVIVMLHGLGGTSNTFETLMAGLEDYRVIRPDLPGAGRSPIKPGINTLQDLSRAITDALKAIRVRKAIIVGHSMGTMLAQYMAVSAPQRVRGLILFGALTDCLLYTSPSPRDQRGSRMPSSA